MKLFFDLFPVVLFYVVYKMVDIYAATAVVIGATGLQVVALYVMRRSVERQYLFTFLAVLILGGLTLVLRNPSFIKWKPTLVNWGLGVAFLASQFWGPKPLVRRMMEKALDMPDSLWTRLNLAWVAFFVLTGVVNLAVAYAYSENAWVNFKLYGLTGMAMLFMIGQVFLLREYLPEEEPAAAEGDEGAESAGG